MTRPASIRQATGFRGVRAAWRASPEWRKLFLARAISLVGTWFNALVLIELLVGGSEEPSHAGQGALALAIVFVLKQGPLAVLSPTAGVLADRLDRRRILIACEFAAVVVSLGFLLLEPGGPAIWVYLLTAAQMTLTAFFMPAYKAILPSVVEPEHLVAANVATSATWSITFALGMWLGGIVLAFAGWRVAVLVDALTFLASGLIVLSMHWQSTVRPRTVVKSIGGLLGLEEMRDGLRYIRETPDVRRLLIVKLGWGSMGVITLILALLGRSDYQIANNPSLGVSFLWGCRALGTLFGPLLAYRFAGADRERLGTAISIAFFVAPLSYAAFALCHDFWLGGLFVFVAHLGGATIWVISTVILQQIVPDEFRGRTFAAELGLFTSASCLGMLTHGWLIEIGLLTARSALLIACAICLVPAIAWVLRPETLDNSAHSHH